jgi:hypothetical protein
MEKLASFRIELIDLAFVMDRRGHAEAADIAMTISARLEELCEEFKGPDLVQRVEATGSRR